LLAVAAVDESLFALAPDAMPALVSFFHPLRRQNVASGHSAAFRSYDWARPTARLPEPPRDPKVEEKSKDDAGALFSEGGTGSADPPRPAESSEPGPAASRPEGESRNGREADHDESEDAEAEKKRLASALEKKKGALDGARKKLENPSFRDKAPPNVVADARAKADALWAEVQALESELRSLGRAP
jgi:hypothetical protein